MNSEHVEVLWDIRNWMASVYWDSRVDALDAAIASLSAPSTPVGVECHVKALCELRDTGDVSDWRLLDAALDIAIAALAQQPAACPHRERCECIGTCKHGMAGSGATEIAAAQQPAADRVCPNTLQACRCDKYTPCAAQQPAAVQKGYKNGLNAALGVIANLGVADSEAQTNGREDAYRAVEALAAQQGDKL